MRLYIDVGKGFITAHQISAMKTYSPVLLAEDEPDDVFLIQRAFQDLSERHPLQVVPNGAEAIHYLAGEDGFANRTAYPFPILLLLDLKMPVKDGFAVLDWLKQHSEVRHRLSVVVLTSLPRMMALERLGAFSIDALFEKPIRYDVLVAQMQQVKSQWLERDFTAN